MVLSAAEPLVVPAGTVCVRSPPPPHATSIVTATPATDHTRIVSVPFMPHDNLAARAADHKTIAWAPMHCKVSGMTRPPCRTVLIAGAGIAGPTLAYWLHRAGFAPTIVERAPRLRTGGYMVDFWGAGYDVAKRMGLGSALEARGYRMREVRIVNRAGRRIGGFDASVFASAAPTGFTSLPRGDLAWMLYGALDPGVELILGDSVLAVAPDADGVPVTFAHHAPRRFDLVIGADGLHSGIRSLLFGPPAQYERFLGYYTAAFSIDDYPHQEEGVFVMYNGPGQQLARYALRGGRTAFLLIHATDVPVGVEHRSEELQRQLLHDWFRHAGWEAPAILAALDRADDLYFDAVAQAHVPRWSAGRLGLVGDAAYAPSLLAGQGCALGMAGAYILATEIANTPEEPERAFRAYERRFRPFVEEKQRRAAQFAKWFAPRSALQLWLRNLVTRSMSLPAITRAVAHRTLSDQLTLDAFPATGLDAHALGC